MEKLSKWIVKFRNVILVVAILLLIPSVYGYLKTDINYDLLSYLPASSESMKAQDVLGDEFNLSSVDFLVLNNKTEHEEEKSKIRLTRSMVLKNVFGEMMSWTSQFQRKQFQITFRKCFILVIVR